MALVPAKIKKAVEAKIIGSFQREFGSLQGDNAQAMESWEKQARVAGDIAEAIVEAILKEAEVAPGIPVTTSGGPGSTSSPGKII